MSYLWRSRILTLAVVSLSVFLLCSSALASQQPDWATLTKALKSSAVLTVETKKGQQLRGLAFVAFREGIAVTTLDPLRNARNVTMRFSDGGEYHATGLIDRDEKHGIALISINVSGHSPLKLATAKLPLGTVVQCGAVKEDTFGFVKLTVAEAHQGSAGVERYILAGDIPSGNLGAPVFDSKGQVLGILVESKTDGSRNNVLLPASRILALDNSLPTRSWEGQTTASAKSAPGVFTELNESLAGFLVVFADTSAVLDWGDYTTNDQGYHNGVPQKVYDYQAKLGMALRNLKTITTEDPLRKKVLKAFLEAGNSAYVSLEYWIKGIRIGQAAESWTAQADDMHRRCKANLKLSLEILGDADSGLKELLQTDETFRGVLSKEAAYQLKLRPRPSKFRLGVYCLPSDSLYLMMVVGTSLASQLGLVTNDRIVSVDVKGSAPQNIEDFKLLLQNNLGQKLNVIVERDGKRVQIGMTIPQTIPTQYLY